MMNIEKFSHGPVTLEYVQKGIWPLWLIHTGTHGDEAGVIESVRIFLEKHGPEIPDFLWVKAVSPSAVELGTRKNKYGNDLNRMFRGGATDPEALANMAFLLGHQFEYLLSIHEDPDHFNTFYLYDSQNVRGSDRLNDFFAKLFSHGIHAFNGIDDPADPVLGNLIRDGYFADSEGRPVPPGGDGTATDYFHRIGCVTGRCLNPEVPGLAKQDTKDLIAQTFFEYAYSCWSQF